MAKNTSSKKMVSELDFQKVMDDFRHMNPNDPGTWQFVPRMTVLMLIFLGILALAWYFVWSDQIIGLQGKEAERETLKQSYLDKKREAINLDSYKQQQAEIDRTFGAMLKQLTSRSEIEALLIEVNQAGLGRGLQFELFRPSAEQVKDFYAELPIQIRINGTYHDLGAFASDIANLPRIVTLNNLSITPGKDGSNLILDATTKTFRYLDQSETKAKAN